MNRYLAKLMFAVNVENRGDMAEFDEQIRIIEARTLEGAFYKARSIGKAEEETFTDRDNHHVSWKFIDVAEVYALGDMKDGEQVYSNTHRIADSTSYITYIRQKSMEIQAKNLIFA
jgi:predicted glycosyltransferase